MTGDSPREGGDEPPLRGTVDSSLERVSMGISGLLRGARDVPDVGLVPPRASAVGASLRESAASEDMRAGVPGATTPGTEELGFLRSVGFGRRGPIALCGADPDRTQDLAPARTPVFFRVY